MYIVFLSKSHAMHHRANMSSNSSVKTQHLGKQTAELQREVSIIRSPLCIRASLCLIDLAISVKSSLRNLDIQDAHVWAREG